MSVLVFGKTGQVATELQRRDKTGAVLALGRAEANLSDPAACAAAIRAHKPRAVINAAAYTAVDKAEEEETQAHLINADAPGAMATACADLDIPFVHISTDYVFAGTGTVPWRPDDPTAPPNAYGRSKWAGEQAVRAAGGRYGILRTSWVFSAHGANFVKTMLRLAETRDALSVVDDQIGGPTPATGIADAVRVMAEGLASGQRSGTWHYAGAPHTSWAGFARETFALAGKTVTVTSIATTDWPTPATRPLNSRMECASLLADFNIPPADWKAALLEVVKEVSQ